MNMYKKEKKEFKIFDLIKLPKLFVYSNCGVYTLIWRFLTRQIQNDVAIFFLATQVGPLVQITPQLRCRIVMRITNNLSTNATCSVSNMRIKIASKYKIGHISL